MNSVFLIRDQNHGFPSAERSKKYAAPHQWDSFDHYYSRLWLLININRPASG
jgi:hypothetical protein